MSLTEEELQNIRNDAIETGQSYSRPDFSLVNHNLDTLNAEIQRQRRDAHRARRGIFVCGDFSSG